jgi:hypothetical protein
VPARRVAGHRPVHPGRSRGGHAPDPLLATIIDTVAGEDGKGLARLSDDQLIGVIAAIRRLESRAAWYLLAAVAEFTARNTDEECAAEFAADQLACELHLSVASAAVQMDYARTVTSRLPATFAALRAGRVHPLLTGQSLPGLWLDLQVLVISWHRDILSVSS